MAQPKDYGFDASLKKPYTKAEISELLENLMK